MSYVVRPFHRSAIAPPEGFSSHRWPESWASTRLPLDLEIGCGVGWHPIQYAKSNPDRRLIAIEHTRAKFDRFTTRLNSHPELTNLVAIHGDAVRWTTHLFETEAVSRVLLLYPNPEPKAANKRWIRMPFFARILEVLVPGGEVVIATNELDYFNEVLEWGERAWDLSIRRSRSFDATSVGHPPRTHFEKKYLARGQTCHDVVFTKPS